MSENNSLFLTGDGSHSLSSAKFGVSYHSMHGAIQETQHVFIDAGLRFKAIHQADIKILEIGFGTGLNAYMTYLESLKRNLSVQYHTIEAFPVDPSLIDQLNYLELLHADVLTSLEEEDISTVEDFPETEKILPRLPEGTGDIFKQMHQVSWNVFHSLDPDFSFLKYLGLFEEVSFPEMVDLVYFDAFAPNAQAEFWEPPFLEKVYQCLNPEACLVTYCAKGSFKRNLKAVGFTVERLPGPPGKREMTRALKL